MRILAIDPSFTSGWVIVDNCDLKTTIVAHGFEDVSKSKHKYNSIGVWVSQICRKYNVDHVIVESQFYKSMYTILGAIFSGVEPFITSSGDTIAPIVLNEKSLSKEAREQKRVSATRYEFDYGQIRKILFNYAKVEKEPTQLALSKYFPEVLTYKLDESDALALVLAYLTIEKKTDLVFEQLR